MTDTNGRDTPRRHLDKKEAIRHLIHAAFRLIAAGEDPFAIHLLIQSAHKMVLDVAKKEGKALTFDWEGKIRPERRAEFFGFWLETYNYFKHADRDFSEPLPVYDIARMNAVTLFITMESYRELYGTFTDHMRLYYLFIQLYMPDVFTIPAAIEASYKAELASLDHMTPSDFFSLLIENHKMLTQNFDKEKVADICDALEFYATPFSLRKTP